MTILVATDFSENSLYAVRYASQLAARQGENLLVFHVVDIANSDNAWRVLVQAPDEVESDAVAQAHQDLEKFYNEGVPEHMRPKNVRWDALMGNPIDRILEKAREEQVSYIVAGTRGASRLQEILLGSTAHRMVRQSDIPVILVPPKYEQAGIRKILAPVDFSDGSKRSLNYALDLARREQAKLSVLYAFVLPEFTAIQTTTAHVTEQLQEIARTKGEDVVRYFDLQAVEDVDYSVEVLQLPPHMAIVDFANQNGIDLICIGSHGRQGWARFFLGNTAEKVLRHTPCPVLVVGGK